MNCAVLKWVADQDDLALHLQAVLLRLVKLMDDDGRISMAQAEIAPHVGLGARQTRQAIQDLVTAKALTRKRQGCIAKKGEKGVGKGRAPDLLSANFERSRDNGDSPPLSVDLNDNGEAPPLPPISKQKRDNGDKGTPSPVSVKSADNGDNAATLPISEVQDAEFVDNPPAPCIGTGARAETLNLNTSGSEIHPEPPHQPKSESVRAAPAKVLNGSAKTLPTPKLAAIIVEHVNSRMLDPSKYAELNTTTARIKVWMDAGADFDADILPAIREGCEWLESVGDPARRWKVFDKFVTGATKRRLEAEAPMLPITAEAKTYDQSPSAYRGQSGNGGRALSTSSEILLQKIARGRADEERRMEPHAGK